MDENTQRRLGRGERTMEILKQGLHEPQPVAQQVVTLFALSHGYIDNIPVQDVRRFEQELAAYMRANHQDVYDQIAETGKLPEGDVIDQAIKDFKETSFQTSDSDKAAKN